MINSSATEYFHVTRTLAALDHLADAPRTATQIADALAIHPRTARRLLNRLVHDGWADLTPGARPRYALAPRFSSLAVRALTQHALRPSDAERPDDRDRGARYAVLAFELPRVDADQRAATPAASV